MIPDKRRAAIIALATEDGAQLTVEEIASRFGISKETARRDLRKLDRTGQLRRVHGGALPTQTSVEPDISERRVQNQDLKLRIGAAAARLFSPGDSLMIDAGTTTSYFALALAKVSNLIVITNSVEVATGLWSGKGHSNVVLLGGEFKGDPAEVVGPMTVEQIDRFSVDHAVLTVGAIDVENGLVMDYDLAEATVARAMIRRASSITVLADHTKFERRALCTVCSLSEIDRIVTDDPVGISLKRKIAAHRIEIITD